MLHVGPTNVPHLQTPAGSSSERLTAEELSAFREQFRALSDVTNAPLDDVADSCVPARIGHFSIVRRLGSGNFGCVYLAYDSRLSRNVAIKVSHLGIHTNGDMRAQFIREAHAAARLAHPNVVCLHEYGEEQGLLYLVYEMCQGPTLEDWIAAQTEPIPVRLAVGIVRELALGLAHAHVRGLVHRDVKPNNVLLTPNFDEQSWMPYTPRITDFGLAHDCTSDVGRSLSARLVGTIDTMSPEQARGDAGKISPAADQYSLGIILYRLLTGTVPFTGDDVIKTLQRICNEHPRSPRGLRREVSRDLAAIVMTCLNKRREARYASCQELARDLDRYLRGLPVAARPLRIHQRGWRVLRAAPVVSVLVLTLLLGSFASAVTFSMMASSLSSQQYELRHTVSELVASQFMSVRSQKQTEAALAGVTEQKRVAELQRLQAVRQAYRADVHRAYEAWHKKHVLATLDMIDAIHSNIEGIIEPCYGLQLLENQVRALAKRLDYHDAPATEVKSIAGTSLVVTAGHSGRLNFHHAETGNLEHSLVPQPGCRIDGLDISRDGTKIAVGYNSPTLISPFAKVYPLSLQATESWLEEAEATFYTTTTVESLQFSPCGKYLAIGQRYEPVAIHDMATGKLLAKIPSDSRNRSVDFSPDSKTCLVSAAEQELVLAATQSGLVAKRIPCGAHLQYARWSPCGDWLAYARYGEAEVTMISADDEQRTVVLSQDHGNIESLSFSPDGCWLVAGTRRGGVAAWSLDDLSGGKAWEGQHTGRLFSSADFVSHTGEVTSVCVVGEKWIASVSDSGSVVLNPLPDCSVDQLGSDVAVAAVMREATGDLMLQGCRDGRVLMVRHETKQRYELVGPGSGAVSALCCSRDGKLAAVGWKNGRIAIVDLVTYEFSDCGYPLPLDSLDERKVNSLCFDEDSTHLAACGDDARLRVWTVKKLAMPCWEAMLRSYAFVTCFCGPGHVAVGGLFEEILVFNCDSGKSISRIAGASRTISLLYDPQRGHLVSGHKDGRLRIHSGENWQQVDTLNGEAGEIVSLVGSPNWDNYVSGDSQGNLKIWSARQHEFIGNLQSLPQKQYIASLSVDPVRHDLLVFHADLSSYDEQPPSELSCLRLSVR